MSSSLSQGLGPQLSAVLSFQGLVLILLVCFLFLSVPQLQPTPLKHKPHDFVQGGSTREGVLGLPGSFGPGRFSGRVSEDSPIPDFLWFLKEVQGLVS